jgi:hypothetical protein
MGEAAHGNDHNNVFASLEIWRTKVASDLSELPQTGDKLRVLLEQGKLCEQVRAGGDTGHVPRTRCRLANTMMVADAALCMLPAHTSAGGVGLPEGRAV